MKPLTEDGRQMLGSTITMLTLAVVSVVLRFILRFATRKVLPLSDGLIFLALICMSASASMIIHYTVAAPGRGSFDPEAYLENAAIGGMVWVKGLLHMLYAANLFNLTCMTLIKLSLLAFFHTLFSVSDTFRWCNWLTAVLCIIWFIASLIASTFLCRPIHLVWDSMGSAKTCLASGSLGLGMELTNLFLDVVILCLPLSMLKALPLTFGQKCQVAGIFLLGGLQVIPRVCITSMVKLAYIWVPSDPRRTRILQTCLWTEIQLGIATLCACLPTYASLFRLARRKFRSSSSNDKVYGDSPQSPYNRVPGTLPDGTYVEDELYQMDSSGRIYMEQSVDVDVAQLRKAVVRYSHPSACPDSRC
ncbi:hypothetical protein BO78DRAFT_437359 [Aspergillus sclerotiicarbonarius CBS 121057]|uniref:Rhodopsin domain-containing protein n=1 Tax=Aspergillus sclerotiicarbonarius (strain CBS 121057 / IBT 28362) TaxID=1448318 RepID=A0A319FLM4_ASPSB|nr:hypothetical protein BO78DRAFT_437359 [Aspergillus sclerotiicarbonarius CBS 121057]